MHNFFNGKDADGGTWNTVSQIKGTMKNCGILWTARADPVEVLSFLKRRRRDPLQPSADGTEVTEC